MQGHIFILSGPSGVGKDVTLEAMRTLPEYDSIGFVTPRSYTTRRERTGNAFETNYIFVSEDEFDSMIGNEVLESTYSHGDRYGMSKTEFEKCLLEGRDMLKVLDMNGARLFKDLYPNDATIIYMRPPTIKILEERLAGRKSESSESFAQRMSDSLEEMRNIADYDYVITNNDMNNTAKIILDIILLVLNEKKNGIGVFAERK